MSLPDKQVTVRVRNVKKLSAHNYLIEVTDDDGFVYSMSLRDPICIGYVMSGTGRYREYGSNYFIPNNSQILSVDANNPSQYAFRHLQ